MSRDWSNLTWREKTSSERAQTVIANTLASIAMLAMVFGGLLVLGHMMDNNDRRSVERHHCLKNATNGLEIEQCR